MGEERIPVRFIMCKEEDIQKMNSKKEQLKNSIEEQEEKSTEELKDISI
jgi:hypothetical protein